MKFSMFIYLCEAGSSDRTQRATIFSQIQKVLELQGRSFQLFSSWSNVISTHSSAFPGELLGSPEPQ